MTTEDEVRRFLEGGAPDSVAPEVTPPTGVATEDDVRSFLGAEATPASTPASTPKPSGLSGGLRTLAQGATLGFGDELEAAARGAGALVPGGASPGEAFKSGLKGARTDIEQFREEHPVAAPLLEIGGGIATGGPGLLRSGARVGARTAGRGLLRRLAGTQAARGGVEGAVAGAGAAEGGLPQRLAGAAVGGTVGLATGGTVQAGGALTRPAGQRAARRLQGALGKTVLPDRPMRAADDVTESMQSTARAIEGVRGLRGRQDQGLAGVIAGLRPGETIMDIAKEQPGASTRARLFAARGGTPIQRLARGAEALGGEGGEQIRRSLTERAAGATDDVTEALTRHSGLTFENAVETADNLAQRQRNTAAPLYEEAYKRSVPLEGPLKDALKFPQFRQAYETGRRIAAVEGVELPDVNSFFRRTEGAAKEVAQREQGLLSMGLTPERIRGLDLPEIDAGEPIGAMPIQAVDYMKRGLDDLIDLRRQGRAGLGQQEARALIGRKNDVLKWIDEQVPEYGTARAAFAGDAATREAFDAGRQGSRDLGLKQFTTEDPEVISRTLSDMTPSEQEMYRRGAFDDVRGIIEKAADNRDLTRTLFGNETMRKRMKLLFPDEDEFNAFRDEMIRFRKQAGTEQFVLGGSPTSRIDEEKRALAGAAPEILGDIAQAGISPHWAAMGLARRGARTLGQGFGRRTAAELAPFLTATAEDAPTVGRTLQDLVNQIERRERMLSLARRGLTVEPGLQAGRAVSGR